MVHTCQDYINIIILNEQACCSSSRLHKLLWFVASIIHGFNIGNVLLIVEELQGTNKNNNIMDVISGTHPRLNKQELFRNTDDRHLWPEAGGWA